MIKKDAIPDDMDWIKYNLHLDSTLPLFHCKRRKQKEIPKYIRYYILPSSTSIVNIL